MKKNAFYANATSCISASILKCRFLEESKPYRMKRRSYEKKTLLTYRLKLDVGEGLSSL